VVEEITLKVAKFTGEVVWAVRARYLSDRGYTDHKGLRLRWRAASDFVKIEDREEGEESMSKLYQTRDGARFGTFLARNSRGEFVLEMKDTGKVEALAADLVEEVRPYTVRVRFMGDSGGGTYDYISQAGALEKGDMVALTSSGRKIVIVTAIDTKSAKATVVLRGRKLLTEELAAPEGYDTRSSEDEED